MDIRYNMDIKLGINCGFAINKYIEPEVWTKIVAKDLGLKYVQFVADLLNPLMPAEYISEQVERLKSSIAKNGIAVDSVFTSAFTRINHLMHPDANARKIWLTWFKDLFSIAAELGAKSGGSHFGIQTFDSYETKSRRDYLIKEGIKGWQELSFFAKDIGFDCIIFEPMSVPREMGNTIEESIELMERVNENCGVPMKCCLDIGHAPHPDYRDPYPWIEKLGAVSPIIHIQQTELNKSNHWPFIKEYNDKGIIHPEKVLESLKKSGCQSTLLMFEISHREHLDTDFRIIRDLKESVDYWKPFVPVE